MKRKKERKKENCTFHGTGTYICNVLPGFLIDCPANVTETSAQGTAHRIKGQS